MSFTHLHLASGFSFKYGTTLPHLLVEKARDFGMSSLALTDRDGLYGAINVVAKSLKKLGFKCQIMEFQEKGTAKI